MLQILHLTIQSLPSRLQILQSRVHFRILLQQGTKEEHQEDCLRKEKYREARREKGETEKRESESERDNRQGRDLKTL
jgi:hypothetical protein